MVEERISRNLKNPMEGSHKEEHAADKG